ncbi:D-alanine--poly(phosphoribitol) ligase subunit 1 [Staphylococcus aureus]|uniref:D-alanine--poly(Phosphoribitol) ligase subunit 1 n=1 Tax=Staphylococcus aureus TaxID=1280 RepID=A0A380E190_STAAU|nr:D-alanine--poly(phosphoribitol) ligase subunit 1 [Staphylococcus aureus]
MASKDQAQDYLRQNEGELVIEGQSVSLGYLKNDQKTAEVFNFDDGFVLITLVIKRSLKMVNGSFKVVLISKSN